MKANSLNSSQSTLSIMSNNQSIQFQNKKIKENIKYPPHVRNAIIQTLQAKKFSQTQISKILNITPQYLSTLVHSDSVDINYTDSIREEIRKAVLKTIADMIVYSISEQDLQKASLQQKVTSAAILIEKYRLLEDKSTQNISVSQLISVKRELAKDSNKLQPIDNNKVIDIASDNGDYVSLKGQDVSLDNGTDKPQIEDRGGGIDE